MENKTIEEKQKVYKKICPYCGTGIISMYEKQLDFNYGVHESTCPENPKNKKENENVQV
jgi:hypothetical protein